ncbi:MAG: type IV secretory system conjugative DNA transfer family protein [Ruthenibacterium sp.]
MDELKEKIRKSTKKFKMLNKKQQTYIYLAAIFLMCLYPSGKIAGILIGLKYQKPLLEALSTPMWKCFIYAVLTPQGLFTTIILTVTIFLLIGFLNQKNNDLNKIKRTDERDFEVSTNGTYGTADVMSREEAEETFEVCNVRDAEGIILGQFTSDGKEVIAIPADTQRNRNIMVLGSPGTGKSYGYVRTAVFQCMKRGESICITDPKGEIHEDMRQTLEDDGYTVKVFNLLNLIKSDSWNCMSEIYNPYTGDYDELRAAEFADTVMKNTNGDDGKEDGFWGPGEQNLFKVAISYCGYIRDVALKKIYAKSTAELINKLPYIQKEDANQLFEIVTGEDTTMNERKSVVEYLAREYTGSEEMMQQYMKEAESKAPLCDMSRVYYLLITNDISMWEALFAGIPIGSAAAIAWAIFKGSGERVSPGFVTGLNQRLQLFQMRDIRRITTNDDIRFVELGEKKCAYFCIISDKSTAMRVLTSLFFNFMFKDVSDAADYYGASNRRPVTVICDEFANLGTLPSFEVVISTVRSRRMNISIILQSITQLQKVYRKENAETIISCCDTILFLGCNDDTTANFISGLSGTMTVRVLSVKDDRNNAVGYRQANQGYSLSEGDGKRQLYNIDEVRCLAINEVLIYHRGCHMLKANRFGFVEHPYFKEKRMIKTRVRDLPTAREKYRATENLDSFVIADIDTLNERNSAQAKKDLDDKKRPIPNEATKKSHVGPTEKEMSPDGHPLKTKGSFH